MPESHDFIATEECGKPFELMWNPQCSYVDESHDFITTEECAKAFMSRSEHPKNLQRIYVDGFLDVAAERTPGFRLPSDPPNCCDLCTELQNMVVRAIGPDLRFESTQAVFFSGSRKHLVLKLHVQQDMYPVDGHFRPSYFVDRCFHIYTHPGILCSWGLLKPYPFQKLEWAFGKLKKCASEHDCYEKGPTPLPTRVLNVGRGPEDVRLQRGGVCARYICLSHCWGSEQPLITTKQNIDDHLVCIVWKDMPLLYQDTVRLAWRLGIEYVWIDSLCIIQDSADDWAREAGRMKDVYGSSWLTIAATSNPDCSSGILDNPYDEEPYARFASFKDSLQYSGITRQNESFSWLAVPQDIDRCDDEKHEKGACRWPLLTRGWVLQEQLLSPRVLYFAAARLTLVCGQGSQVEHSAVGNCHVPGHLCIITSDMKARNKGNSDRWFDFGRLWSYIVQEYSKLKLTNRDDRLSALSGLAESVSQRQPRGNQYLAGLWSFSLFQGLSWYNTKGSRRGTHSATGGVLTACTRQLSQVDGGVPSWSWVAISTGVSFPRMPYYRDCPTISHARICGTECTPASRHDPTGRVSNGRIHLRGPISPVTNSDPALINNSATTIYFDCPVHMDFNSMIDKKIKCLSLYTERGWHCYNHGQVQCSVGLLLQPVRGKDYEYRRVGLVTAERYLGLVYDPSGWFNRLSDIEDVVIV